MYAKLCHALVSRSKLWKRLLRDLTNLLHKNYVSVFLRVTLSSLKLIFSVFYALKGEAGEVVLASVVQELSYVFLVNL